MHSYLQSLCLSRVIFCISFFLSSRLWIILKYFAHRWDPNMYYRVKVDLGMMKGYSTPPRSLELDSHYQIQISVIHRKSFLWGGSNRGHSPFILRPTNLCEIMFKMILNCINQLVLKILILQVNVYPFKMIMNIYYWMIIVKLTSTWNNPTRVDLQPTNQ